MASQDSLPRLTEDLLKKIAWSVFHSRSGMKTEEFAVMVLLRQLLSTKNYNITITANIHTTDTEPSPYFSAEICVNPHIHYPIHYLGQMRGSRFIVSQMKVYFKGVALVKMDVPEFFL